MTAPIRPEDLRIAREPSPYARARRQFGGQVEEARYRALVRRNEAKIREEWKTYLARRAKEGFQSPVQEPTPESITTLARMRAVRSQERYRAIDTALFPRTAGDLAEIAKGLPSTDPSRRGYERGGLGVDMLVSLSLYPGVAQAVRDIATDIREDQVGPLTGLAALAAIPVIGPVLRLLKGGGKLNRFQRAAIEAMEKGPDYVNQLRAATAEAAGPHKVLFTPNVDDRRFMEHLATLSGAWESGNANLLTQELENIARTVGAPADDVAELARQHRADIKTRLAELKGGPSRTDQELVASAASRNTRTGKVSLGHTHADSFENALRATGLSEKQAGAVIEEGAFDRFPIEDGFVTTSGRFVNRKEAFRLSTASRQDFPSYRGELHAGRTRLLEDDVIEEVRKNLRESPGGVGTAAGGIRPTVGGSVGTGPFAEGSPSVLRRPLTAEQRAMMHDPRMFPEPERRVSPERRLAFDEILRRHGESGGSTADLRSGKAVEEGYAVSPYKDREEILTAAPTAENLRDFADSNADLLEKPGHTIGTWHDKERGQHVIDVIVTPKKKGEAMRLALQTETQAEPQRAIFDLGKGEEIPVAGTAALLGATVLSDEEDPGAAALAGAAILPSRRQVADVSRRFGRLLNFGRGAGLNWYPFIDETTKQIFGPHTETFARQLAAASPRTPWLTRHGQTPNIDVARLALREVIEGVPTGTYAKTTPTVQANLERARRGEDLGGLFKSRPFSQNLMGDLDPVISQEMWMGKAAGVGPTPSDVEARLIEEATRAVARGEGLEPARAQAGIWTGMQLKEGAYPGAFLAEAGLPSAAPNVLVPRQIELLGGLDPWLAQPRGFRPNWTGQGDLFSRARESTYHSLFPRARPY